MAAKPVISASALSSSSNSWRYPSAWSSGAKGWIFANPGQVIGIISAVAFSFIVHDRVAKLSQAFRERRGKSVHPPCNAGQTLRPVIDRVHARNDRQQHLGGADITRRLLAANVLLSRLKRHAQRRLSVRIARHANDASRNVTL